MHLNISTKRKLVHWKSIFKNAEEVENACIISHHLYQFHCREVFTSQLLPVPSYFHFGYKAKINKNPFRKDWQKFCR
jgi:hypothetical protein